MAIRLAVALICGRDITKGSFTRRHPAYADRLTCGHEMLVKIAGADYGYDLQAWHNHLKLSRQGGYTYARNIKLPKIMQVALASNEWQAAVAAIRAKHKSSSR